MVPARVSEVEATLDEALDRASLSRQPRGKNTKCAAARCSKAGAILSLTLR